VEEADVVTDWFTLLNERMHRADILDLVEHGGLVVGIQAADSPSCDDQVCVHRKSEDSDAS
jgi:hypothetical protein